MTTVATCSNLAEAELLHSLLTDQGLEAFVLDDAFGGTIRLQVDEADAEAARRLLAEAEAAAAGDDEDVVDAGGDAPPRG